ncbi:uncharacterized protein BHQ10_006205 [Talaromyces amestolkiae]|uniref:Transcription factor domain-containing protein n=1 Tax=Talaromyces amestolkiae TaxID=1196081 RepID=A0A364L313_TALAM|nr:uncharacterized protein BHQ10_006205 [Talaromyces amestolkiae]RAO70193.1 hypothetical protein BHQ10_006205 [Talaromyces amestolkiae]
MLQWRSTRPPQMQDAIDYFLGNFVLNAESPASLICSGSVETFDIVPVELGPGRAVIQVLDTLTAGLLVIRAACSQTIEERQQQHVKYWKAMSELRESLSLYPTSRALVAPIFLFALYEMIVNTSETDMTWQIHLNGMLAMMKHNQNARGSRTAEMTNLSAARQFAVVEKTSDIQEFFSSRPAMDNIEKAWLLLDITKVRLKMLVTIMDRFRAVEDAQNTTSFKKLEVEKLRVSVKRIQRDLHLIPNLLPKEFHPVKIPQITGCDIPSGLPPTYIGYYAESYIDSFLCTKWNEYRALMLIIGDFLLRTGRFLYSGTTRPNVRESTALTRTIREAVEGWNMRIPKAMALAHTGVQELTYSEILAGLMLLGSGVLRSV